METGTPTHCPVGKIAVDGVVGRKNVDIILSYQIPKLNEGKHFLHGWLLASKYR